MLQRHRHLQTMAPPATWPPLDVMVMALAFLTCCRATATGFDYSAGPNGPGSWGKLKPAWRSCQIGCYQSPINVVPSNVTSKCIRRIGFLYHPSTANLTFGPSFLHVDFTGPRRRAGHGGSVFVRGHRFQLRSFRIHSPSEHILNGSRFPLEGQFEHVDRHGKKIILALLYRLGRQNSFIERIEKHLDDSDSQSKSKSKSKARAKSGSKTIDLGILNPPQLTRRNHYYFYHGSMTTPPCTENVLWLIAKNVRTVSLKQLKSIQSILGGGNARFVQELKGRVVYSCK